MRYAGEKLFSSANISIFNKIRAAIGGVFTPINGYTNQALSAELRKTASNLAFVGVAFTFPALLQHSPSFGLEGWVKYGRRTNDMLECSIKINHIPER